MVLWKGRLLPLLFPLRKNGRLRLMLNPVLVAVVLLCSLEGNIQLREAIARYFKQKKTLSKFRYTANKRHVHIHTGILTYTDIFTYMTHIPHGTRHSCTWHTTHNSAIKYLELDWNSEPVLSGTLIRSIIPLCSLTRQFLMAYIYLGFRENIYKS